MFPVPPWCGATLKVYVSGAKLRVRLETRTAPLTPCYTTLAVTDLTISMVRPHLHAVPHRPLPEGYVLRVLEPTDESQLAQLLTLAFADTWDAPRVAAALTQAPDVKAVYGVFQGRQLVGTASSRHLPGRDPAAGFVHWVATHPDKRAQGLASALLEHVLSDFQTRGYSRARLDTQPERLPAIRAYLKFGFVPEYEVAGTDQRAVWSDVFPELLRATT